MSIPFVKIGEETLIQISSKAFLNTKQITLIGKTYRTNDNGDVNHCFRFHYLVGKNTTWVETCQDNNQKLFSQFNEFFQKTSQMKANSDNPFMKLS